MKQAIAIVGMACRYPDAGDPRELWENALSQRRAFRRIPAERLRLEDYFSTDRKAADRIYSTEAAVIEGYEFDRVRFRVAGSTYRSADLSHWLALDVAAGALDDAGFHDGAGLPLETTGVLLGNTLTGEFSRANLMRLRWPYVQRVIEAELRSQGWAADRIAAFLAEVETNYKKPFPEIGEESLAGGLSNTIAGRICNHFDLHGGGFVVDGACASSLLAVASACTALASGDLDVALAGGVDLSLDPFELVGFAKTGALASDLMRVFDARSAGFWPGEGCGFVVLMRHDDALRQGRRVHGVIRGWGISSDGHGGITRPEADGQMLALRRAYAKAGYGIDEVAYFEGHGTGTAVGDATELKALTRFRQATHHAAPPAVISSVKACIGHTKAAAGIAGLIKAAMAVSSQILPPAAGLEEPPALLKEKDAALRLLHEAEVWPADRPLRAGVSSMGFGGINCHVTLEGEGASRRRSLNAFEKSLSASPQDAELFLFSARTPLELQSAIERVARYADRISRAQLSDLAAELARTPRADRHRAAIVAGTPADLASALGTVKNWLEQGIVQRIDAAAGCFLGLRDKTPKIGFLFPGQASPVRLYGGIWSRRFETVRDLYQSHPLPESADTVQTRVAQPSIVTASIAGLRVLEQLGIHASVAAGHSLGELTALHWGGALDEAGVLRLAGNRGRFMSELGNPNGAMSSIAAGPHDVKILLNGDNAVIAGLNSPLQTVISGIKEAVIAVTERARRQGVQATLLPVSHAFHSPLVADSIPRFVEYLASEKFRPLSRCVVSTVTSEPLDSHADLRQLLSEQIAKPVRFSDALAAVAERADLLIEVGPGRVLNSLAADMTDKPVLSIDSCGASFRGLMQAAGAAYAIGVEIDQRALFAGRFFRPFSIEWHPSFLQNPCELAPLPEIAPATGGALPLQIEEAQIPKPQIAKEPIVVESPPPAQVSDSAQTPIEMVRQCVARKTELPVTSVLDEHRLLGDLHLNSISVSQIAVEVARALALPAPIMPTDFSTLTVGEMASTFVALIEAGISDAQPEHDPPGIEPWIGIFREELRLQAMPAMMPRPSGESFSWQIFAGADHPLERALREAFGAFGPGGVVLALSADPGEKDVPRMMEAARAAVSLEGSSAFVLVQHGGGGAAFARSLHLEFPRIHTCVIDVPANHPRAIEWIVEEARRASGYREAHYDAEGNRWEPVLRAVPEQFSQDSGQDLPLGPGDVLLATGGGKGITFECALDLARQSGATLLLTGRARPEDDAELRENLARATASGIRHRYLAADLNDLDSLRQAMESARDLGPVTALLHGAGMNSPRGLASLTETDFLRTLAPKLQGVKNVLSLLDAGKLRLFLSLGSLIARTGMRGQADYAVANEWLARLTQDWQGSHPHCRSICLEYSVWTGVGMGHRLGRVEALRQQGITAIPPEQGTALLRRCLTLDGISSSYIIAGRFGESPTLKFATEELPLRRFLERPRVWYPEIELVADSQLSVETDAYVLDHVFHGEKLLPGVMGLEAMAQAAEGLLGKSGAVQFSDVRFHRPVVVPDQGAVQIRLAALRASRDEVRVALLSEETGFQTAHFSARVRHKNYFSESLRFPTLINGEGKNWMTQPRLALEPSQDLYGGILFHGPRFQRILGYRHLKSRECLAEIRSANEAGWYGRFLPQDRVLPDPGVLDAAIHAIQACIPQATLLPIGIENLYLKKGTLPQELIVQAIERSREGDLFTYDVWVGDVDGAVWQHWEGLQLRLIAQSEFRGPWAPSVLSPYLERQVHEIGSEIEISVHIDEANESERRERSEQAIERAVGAEVEIRHRSDGKPEVYADGPDPISVSVSHSGRLTMAVRAQRPVGCDLEPIRTRPEASWKDLLGESGLNLAKLISNETGEDLSAAATRIWSANESLRKAGAIVPASVTLGPSRNTQKGRPLILQAGEMTIATFVLPVKGAADPLAFSILSTP